MHLQFSTAAILAFVSSVHGHANIIAVQGLKAGDPAGPQGMALGLDPATPRDGVAVDPNQRDTTIFIQRTLSLWEGCGQSIEFGVHNASSMIPELVQQGQIAQALPGGQLSMVFHQINGDGNGPFMCAIDTAAVGNRGSWKQMTGLTIATQVPGQSPILNAGTLVQYPFIVNIPANLKCTGSYGGKDNICLMRCQNYAVNGPFGGCIPFELVTSLRADWKMKRDGSGYEKLDPREQPAPTKTVDGVKVATPTMGRPQKEPAANPQQVTALLKKLTNNLPAAAKSASGAPAKPTVKDVLAALTEGDDVPPAMLAALSKTLSAQIAAGTLPAKAALQAKVHQHSKKPWTTVVRPAAAPTKGS
ncbi:hypothetical protein AA313_de0209453 [Arthrobotrys entomopaga]|nr:hypothetical protein AA313_de0209453 [Arthrobotrys entomopaga]